MPNWSNILEGPILMATGSVTGSSTGKAMIFAKPDGKIYIKDSVGTESGLGGTSGDTIITPTVLDIENTTSQISYITLVIPAGLFSNNTFMDLNFYYEIRNFSGADQTINLGTTLNGGSVGFNTGFTIPNFRNGFNYGRIRFYRNNTQLHWQTPNVNTSVTEIYGPQFSNVQMSANFDNNAYGPSVNFNNQNTITFRGQFGTASPSLYLRILNARVRYYAGQAV